MGISKCTIGSKATNLKILQEAGFHVPRFVIIDALQIQKLFRDAEYLEMLATKIHRELPIHRYAVRSAALIEDSATESYAGQFHTELNIAPARLAEALMIVTRHAKKYLSGELSKFSILVQEYIPANFSGITFTRNPIDGREMVVEYHRGIGADVVGGKVRPQKISFFHGQNEVSSSLPKFEMARSVFAKIEQLFDAPQDIEWCMGRKKLFILQTRPITTLSKVQFEQYRYIDEAVPKQRDFLYEKTQISEIAPRPTPATLSLLKMIYEQDGPVHRVYKRLDVHYRPQTFFVVIGNELHVDREKEIRTLLPSYSYLCGSAYRPRLRYFFDLWRTMRNLLAFHRAREDAAILSMKLSELLAKPWEEQISVLEVVQRFLKEYEVIFAVNFFAERAFQKLEHVLRGESIALSDILRHRFEQGEHFSTPSYGVNVLVGNALEISDITPFQKFSFQYQVIDPVANWFSRLPAWKEKFFLQKIRAAQQFERLREFGRWLTVKNITQLRSALLRRAHEMHYRNLDNIFFASISEEIKESDCILSKNEYEQYNQWTMPLRLSARYIVEKRFMQGVSAGNAVGKIVNRDSLSEKGRKILYTKILSPDLVQYFDCIEGIISEKGGMLSHLAIMAREKGIPVIVNVDLVNGGVHLGDTVEIDGSAGTIKKS